MIACNINIYFFIFRSMYFLFYLLFFIPNMQSKKLIGPRNWLVKLSDKEAAEVRQACSPKANTEKSGPEERIAQGNLAKPGDFPFAAVFRSTSANSGTRCGATLISPRHLISARHCFDNKTEESILLMGGVCYLKYEDCKEVDMVEVGFNLSLFDAKIYSKDHLDFAIVQLNESVTKRFPNRTKFACLPAHKDDPVPAQITLFGWGLTQYEPDKLSTHLRFATFETSYFEHSDLFMAQGPSENNQKRAALPGDSGSGAVAYSDELGRYVIHGVISKGSSRHGPNIITGYMETVMIKTAVFVDDFCSYLGLCPAKEQSKVMGLSPKLNLGSIYLPKGRIALEKFSMLPFRKISTEVSEDIHRKCTKSRSQWSSSPDSCELSTLNWASVITNSDNEILCDAVAVTHEHLVTSRECVLPYLKNISHGSGGNLKILKRWCLVDEKCESWKVELLAWSFSHPMMIVQVKSAMDDLPVCFQSAQESKKELEEDFINRELRGYGKLWSLVRQVSIWEIEDEAGLLAESPICNNDPEHFCAKPTKQCKKIRYNGKIKYGTGLIDNRSNGQFLLGIKVQNKQIDFKNDTVSVFWKTNNLLGAICIYLNRCDGEKYAFVTNIPYFSNFFNFLVDDS